MALNTMELGLLNKAADNAEKAHTSAAETRVMVETAVANQEGIFKRMSKVENDIVEIKTKQTDCNARKNFDAGILPGNKSEQASTRWAVFGIICTCCGLVGGAVEAFLKILLKDVL